MVQLLNISQQFPKLRGGDFGKCLGHNSSHATQLLLWWDHILAISLEDKGNYKGWAYLKGMGHNKGNCDFQDHIWFLVPFSLAILLLLWLLAAIGYEVFLCHILPSWRFIFGLKAVDQVGHRLILWNCKVKYILKPVDCFSQLFSHSDRKQKPPHHIEIYFKGYMRLCVNCLQILYHITDKIWVFSNLLSNRGSRYIFHEYRRTAIIHNIL